MTYSYTQISHYLICPRRYRYRYLEGWEEKQVRAGMLFGQTFEKALAAYFRGRDSEAVLQQEWGTVRQLDLDYGGSNWEEMLHQGCDLLQRLANHDRVRVPQPGRNLQVQVLRPLNLNDDFVGIVDGIGTLDGGRCLLEWKVTSRCYRTEPAQLAQLDPQLVCYSWLTGIEQAALIVFVRKRFPEIQYLRTNIGQVERDNFSMVVAEAVQQIHGARFPSTQAFVFLRTSVSVALSSGCVYRTRS